MYRKFAAPCLFALCAVSLLCALAIPSLAEEKAEEKAGGKAGEKKEAGKQEGDAAADEPADFEALMKRVGRSDRGMKKAISNKDAAAARSNAETLKNMAAKALEKDPDADRKAKDDYKKWMKELEDKTKELYDLSAAAKPDWAKIETKRGEVGKVCESCHKVYKKEDR